MTTLVHPASHQTPLLDLLSSGRVAVITGAGISTASGIPAYRDRDGNWQHPPPIQHQDFLRSDVTRRRYWARSFVGWVTIANATPNRGHHALVKLESQGIVSSVITQNVDGLHQRAGSLSVIELHGGINTVRCLVCQATYAREIVQEWLASANSLVATPNSATAQCTPQTARQTPPRTAPDGDAILSVANYDGFNVPVCPSCEGVLKPDVVFYGANVPQERVLRASSEIEAATGLLIIGSSLMVYSAYRFAEQAAQLGKPIMAITQGITRADHLLTAKVDDDCADVLATLAA